MRKSALFLLGLVVTMIVSLGLVVLSSASEAYAIRLFSDPLYFLKRQFIYLFVGLAAMLVVARIDYRVWRDHPTLTWCAFAVVMVGLLAVFAFPAVKGSHRWLPLGPVRLQPSEFAKLMTIVLLSVWLDRAEWKIELFVRGALLPALLVGVILVPILFEPDFGSVMVIGFLTALIMFVAGVRVLHLLPFVGLGAGVFIARVLSNANRMARMAAFFGVQLDIGTQVTTEAAQNAAHQSKAALTALGNGGIWGVGLNESMQKHYYLPEAHTDFIFAIGAEELGLPFSLGVMILFILFFVISVYIAKHASDRFGRFLVVGMASLIFFEAMFNIGVVCKAFPTKGMALPFFSYGGTNLVSAFIAVGAIFSVGIHTLRDRKRDLVRKVIVGRS